ncbi:MAG: HAD-IA family hydrolase [Spirochaetales bacterium]|nr:HAD-IA family hydrolase [Spirochaetales bacterium]
MKNYSCYLFDADGTLIDTAELIYQSYAHVISRFHGKHVTREEIIAGIGKPLITQLYEFFDWKTPDELKEINDTYEAYQFEIAGDYLKLFPGVKQVLGKLKENGDRCVVVTSRMMPSLSVYFKILGIYDFFDYFVTPDMTEKHKPEPDPVLKALELCESEPHDALMTGDSLFDIQSASAAGVHSCFVTWSQAPFDSTIVAPTYRIDSMEELLLL